MSDNIQKEKKGPALLMILDGWGVAPDSIGNAITQANTPNFDYLVNNYFCTTLQASGEAVGLPFGENGNSEVGHLNMGAGKILFQNLPRINRSIVDGSFFENNIFLNTIKHTQKNNSNLHLVGLLSDGGVHSSLDHLVALLELAKRQEVKQVYLHLILDGRDLPFNSGAGLLEELKKKTDIIGLGTISSLIGRFWAMDRDNNWQRVEQSYRLMTEGQAEIESEDPIQAVKDFYKQEVYDEEMKPILVTEKGEKHLIKNGDGVIFFNFRADRARELTKAFVLPAFDKFERSEFLDNLFFATMTQFEKNLPVEIAFPPEFVKIPLAKVLSDKGLKQYHTAETEKYAHVTFFFNGGIEQPFEGEERGLVASPKVDSYAEKPEMSAEKVKENVINAILSKEYDFILVNFANPDMVGHTGDLGATKQAIEKIDECLGEIVKTSMDFDGVAMVIADHGNAEELINYDTGEIDKEHSTAPVPFIVVGKGYKHPEQMAQSVDLSLLTPSGVLADVAPTILKVMGVEKPEEMTGVSLI